MKTELKVQNVVCGGCASTIINALSQMSDISNVEVTIESGLVHFDSKGDSNLTKVKAKLKDLGYPEV